MVEVDSLELDGGVLADFGCRTEITDLAISVNTAPMLLSYFVLDFGLPVNIGTVGSSSTLL